MSALTGYRISPQQAAWWQQSSREAHSSNASWLSFKVEGALSAQIINARLQELSQREEILRTRLDALPGMALPIQVIQDSVEIPFHVLDVKKLTVLEYETKLEHIKQEILTNVLEVWLIEKTEHNVLLLKANSGYLDFYSLQLVAIELMGNKAAQENLQYVDYAEWKYNLREEEPDSPGIHFWKQVASEEIAAVLPGLEKPSSLVNQIARHTIELDKTLNLNASAKAQNLSLEEFLFSAWSILLARLQGQNHTQLSWIDESRGEGLEDGLGLYEQALPVQVDIEPGLPLALQSDALLKHARQAKGWRDFYDNAKIGNAYFAFRQPLFKSSRFEAFNYYGNFSLGLDCLELDCLELKSLETGLASNAIHIQLVYDQNRYSETAIACVAEQLRLLLKGLGNPSAPVGQISLQGDYQAQLTATIPLQTAVESLSVLELIQRQVMRNPQAPALADQSGILSYQEVNARANQLARQLIEQGIKTGDVVGILLPRGNQAIIAILGVMKAGATYLPLDPSYPADRLAYMLEDSDAKLVITTSAHVSILPAQTPRLVLDHEAQQIATQDQKGLHFPGNLQTAAYLIYTSGSTGKPKAVEVSHANLSHSTQVRVAFYKEPVKAYLLLSSFAFDSSVAGIFWTLATGGLLVLPANGEELDLKALAGLTNQHKVSHGLSLPSLYEALLDFTDQSALASLDTWVVAGEACGQQVLVKHNSKVPNARLVNEYGPTEATVWATADVLTESVNNEITIGRPIPSMQLLIVNEAGVLAGVGEPGEIYLGGPSLALGYRNKPEQTALAFITNPALGEGERLYRTGDLARYRHDGRLDFLGRTDHQVKIRGYRVELSEIERVLQSHSEVRDAVVVAQAQSESHRLVAYVTDRHGYVPDSQALGNYLGDRLPKYMVPAVFVHLKNLPRTPNGKIDLKALPEPESAKTSADYVAPRSEMETQLAGICAEVLQRDKVSVLDDFFAIGGDSILSLQIVARANQLGIQITAKQVFECGSIERLAAVASRFEPTANKAKADEPAQAFSLTGLDEESLGDLLAELDAAD
ncbi:MAG: amino acid adenylation domain-containing protein [Cellvibrio sp.]